MADWPRLMTIKCLSASWTSLRSLTGEEVTVSLPCKVDKLFSLKPSVIYIQHRIHACSCEVLPCHGAEQFLSDLHSQPVVAPELKTAAQSFESLYKHAMLKGTHRLDKMEGCRRLLRLDRVCWLSRPVSLRKLKQLQQPAALQWAASKS